MTNTENIIKRITPEQGFRCWDKTFRVSTKLIDFFWAGCDPLEPNVALIGIPEHTLFRIKADIMDIGENKAIRVWGPQFNGGDEEQIAYALRCTRDLVHVNIQCRTEPRMRGMYVVKDGKAVANPDWVPVEIPCVWPDDSVIIQNLTNTVKEEQQ
jgi:hypothetical protein